MNVKPINMLYGYKFGCDSFDGYVGNFTVLVPITFYGIIDRCVWGTIRDRNPSLS